jgi:hypothetical protein
MADDITLPGTGKKIDTVEQSDGAHQQVVQLDGETISAFNMLAERMSYLANTIGRSQPTSAGQMRVVIDDFSSTASLPNINTVSSVTTAAISSIQGFNWTNGSSITQALDECISTTNSAAAAMIYNTIKVT